MDVITYPYWDLNQSVSVKGVQCVYSYHVVSLAINLYGNFSALLVLCVGNPLITVGIDHAVRSATGDHTHAWRRVQPRLLTQNHGQFPFYHSHLGRSNETIHFWSRIIPILNRYCQFQVDGAFLAKYVAMHARRRHNGRRMQTQHAHVKHAREKRLSNEHNHEFETLNGSISP